MPKGPQAPPIQNRWLPCAAPCRRADSSSSCRRPLGGSGAALQEGKREGKRPCGDRIDYWPNAPKFAHLFSPFLTISRRRRAISVRRAKRQSRRFDERAASGKVQSERRALRPTKIVAEIELVADAIDGAERRVRNLVGHEARTFGKRRRVG